MTASGRLIIVEDEPVLLDLLTSLFHGYDVVPCADGAAARAAFVGGVDVLLTDKNLPDASGLDLLDEARRAQADAQVILITGFASLDTAVQALQRGAFDYIVKPPPSIFDVKRKVDQAFARQALARENHRLLVQLREQNEALQDALAEVKAMQAELVQAEKLAGIGTLAAGVAHELSSPLFGVMGLAEAIVDDDTLALAQEHAREIVLQARRIKEIVVQLSGYSRAADRDVPGVVQLDEVAADAVRLLERSLSLPTGRVSLSGAEARLAGRTGEVQQVVVNLVKNAVEAADEHHPDGSGRVDVVVATEADHAVLRVADNGPGIPANIRRHIFDPFFTTKPPGRGTGLGLNIVYRLVNRQGGTVVVEDGPEGGTLMVVRWPLVSEA